MNKKLILLSVLSLSLLNRLCVAKPTHVHKSAWSLFKYTYTDLSSIIQPTTLHLFNKQSYTYDPQKKNLEQCIVNDNYTFSQEIIIDDDNQEHDANEDRWWKATCNYNLQVNLNRIGAGLSLLGAYCIYSSIKNVNNNRVYKIASLIPLYGAYRLSRAIFFAY